jgi:hypothetical protein
LNTATQRFHSEHSEEVPARAPAVRALADR